MTDDIHPFDDYVRQDDCDMRLAEAALRFAYDRYPQMNEAAYLSRLDALACRVERCAGGNGPEDQVRALRTVLVEEEGYLGPAASLNDPSYSYLNDVLDRKVGLPIALSAIWLDITWQLEWPFVGIGLPGHFVIGQCGPSSLRILDPFYGGRLLSRKDCEELVVRGELAWSDSYLAPVTTKIMLARMLNNLRRAYLDRGEWHELGCVLRRLLALNPASEDIQREERVIATIRASLN